MYQHVMIIQSDYSEGKRIALHKCYKNKNGIREFININKKLNERFKHLQFSFHHLQTNKEDIKSIEEYDQFFRNIDYYNNLEYFISEVVKDLEIKPIDIAKILLAKHAYSHLKLQKMLYFTECEYMRIYKKKLFSEEFEAWDYGPVLPNLYRMFCKFKDKQIRKYHMHELEPQLYARLVKIDRYDEIMNAVESAINKYGNLDTYDLRDLSHVKGGPWDKVFVRRANNKISKESMREYAIKEK